MTEPILTEREILEIWTHSENIQSFVAHLQTAWLEKVCGEPRAWLVEGGRMFQDKPFLREANADTSIAERQDGAQKTALYALTRSKP